MHPRLLKVSAPLLLLALLGLASEVRAEGRVRQLVRALTAKVQGKLKLKSRTARVRLVPKAATQTKKTSDLPDPGRRRALRLIGAGLLVGAVAAATPTPVKALDMKGTKKALGWLFGDEAHGSEPAKQHRPAQKPNGSSSVKDRGRVVAPLAIAGATYIRSGYKTPSRRTHRGIDIASPAGTKIRAATDGVVLFSGWNGTRSTGYGRTVVIWREDGGIKTVYGHMASWNVKAGQRVRAGEIIGKVGNSGGVRGKNGYHLHFEWHENAPKTPQTRDGREVNPMPHVYPGH